MASRDPAESVGEALGQLFQVIFSLTFPLFAITVCGVSYLVSIYLPAPEFGLWGALALLAIEYAKANTWAAVVLGVFGIAAIPLAWVAYREHEARISTAIGAWVTAAFVGGGTAWLRTAWPYHESFWQILVFSILLMAAWSAVLEGALSTLKIVVFVRATRPPRRPRWQQPHGRQRRRPPQPHGPRVQQGGPGPGRSSDEPETI